MNRYAWLVNVGSICGLIVLCGALVPKDTVTSPPMVRPVVLADGKWAMVNAGKNQYCRTAVLKIARNTKGLSDEHTEYAKQVYWDCMVDTGGAL